MRRRLLPQSLAGHQLSLGAADALHQEHLRLQLAGLIVPHMPERLLQQLIHLHVLQAQSCCLPLM
jgi:hypothetical protein